MQKGMLWYDSSNGRSLSAKILAAADHYRAKYGQAPNLCYVHLGAPDEVAEPTGAIKVVRVAYVLPHHLWLGVGE